MHPQHTPYFDTIKRAQHRILVTSRERTCQWPECLAGVMSQPESSNPLQLLINQPWNLSGSALPRAPVFCSYFPFYRSSQTRVCQTPLEIHGLRPWAFDSTELGEAGVPHFTHSPQAG